MYIRLIKVEDKSFLICLPRIYIHFFCPCYIFVSVGRKKKKILFFIFPPHFINFNEILHVFP